ncbi:NAD(P)-binding Rossmann-fold superfamily protein [Actinidia rufa]|uniref:NAD(P)-binding Rossmann-fold superfamily protein n=1 Tax=Actinidia rufa TaxID=165716 RepID=A0A7J0EI15_9ERIC|nr:NAD(P)-binding Rossmann-fold superfamily protein [Actinidia rufa]
MPPTTPTSSPPSPTSPTSSTSPGPTDPPRSRTVRPTAPCSATSSQQWSPMPPISATSASKPAINTTRAHLRCRSLGVGTGGWDRAFGTEDPQRPMTRPSPKTCPRYTTEISIIPSKASSLRKRQNSTYGPRWTQMAKKEAINCSNEDVYKWKHLWRVLTEQFRLEDEEFDEREAAASLAEWMRDKGQVWDEIVRENGLVETKLEEVAV